MVCGNVGYGINWGPKANTERVHGLVIFHLKPRAPYFYSDLTSKRLGTSK